MIAQKYSTRHLKYAVDCDLREGHSRGQGDGGRPGAADILGGAILCWFLGNGGKELLFYTLSAGLLKAEWLRMTVLYKIAWIWILVLLFNVTSKIFCVRKLGIKIIIFFIALLHRLNDLIYVEELSKDLVHSKSPVI